MPSRPSKLEAKFLLYWNGLGGAALVPEYYFHETRKWRFDFAHIASRTAFEIQGGIWVQGRHSRGSGQEKEWEKHNSATLLGWRILYFGPGMITTPYLEMIISSLTLTADKSAKVA